MKIHIFISTFCHFYFHFQNVCVIAKDTDRVHDFYIPGPGNISRSLLSFRQCYQIEETSCVDETAQYGSVQCCKPLASVAIEELNFEFYLTLVN